MDGRYRTPRDNVSSRWPATGRDLVTSPEYYRFISALIQSIIAVSAKVHVSLNIHVRTGSTVYVGSFLEVVIAN